MARLRFHRLESVHVLASISLALAMVTPLTTLAAEPSERAPIVGPESSSTVTEKAIALELVIDLAEGDESFGPAMAARITTAMQTAGIEVTDDGSFPLVVDVHWAPGTQTDYIVFFDVRVTSGSLDRVTAFECNHCTPSQFWERLDQVLADRVIPALHAELGATDAETENDDEAASEEPVAAPPPVLPSPARNEAAMFYTGIGMLAVGGGVALGGSTVLVIDEVGGLPKRPLEWTLLGAGVGVTAIGGVLVAVAKSKPRKHRRLTVTPALVPSGVVLTGRF